MRAPAARSMLGMDPSAPLAAGAVPSWGTSFSDTRDLIWGLRVSGTGLQLLCRNVNYKKIHGLQESKVECRAAVRTRRVAFATLGGPSRVSGFAPRRVVLRLPDRGAIPNVTGA